MSRAAATVSAQVSEAMSSLVMTTASAMHGAPGRPAAAFRCHALVGGMATVASNAGTGRSRVGVEYYVRTVHRDREYSYQVCSTLHFQIALQLQYCSTVSFSTKLQS